MQYRVHTEGKNGGGEVERLIGRADFCLYLALLPLFIFPGEPPPCSLAALTLLLWGRKRWKSFSCLLAWQHPPPPIPFSAWLNHLSDIFSSRTASSNWFEGRWRKDAGDQPQTRRTVYQPKGQTKNHARYNGTHHSCRRIILDLKLSGDHVIKTNMATGDFRTFAPVPSFNYIRFLYRIFNNRQFLGTLWYYPAKMIY